MRMRLAWAQRWIYLIESGEIDGFEDAQQDIERDGATFPTDAEGNQVQGEPVGGRVKIKRTQKRPSLLALYNMTDRFARTVADMERQRAEMQSGDVADPYEKGRLMGEVVREMFALTGGSGINGALTRPNNHANGHMPGDSAGEEDE